jgi:hypothetical protein
MGERRSPVTSELMCRVAAASAPTRQLDAAALIHSGVATSSGVHPEEESARRMTMWCACAPPHDAAWSSATAATKAVAPRLHGTTLLMVPKVTGTVICARKLQRAVL